jgi:hypothetical protein
MALGGLTAACGKAEEVRRYKAPKDPTWRMMAAMATREDHTVYFKVSGPSDLLDPHAEEVVGFLKSLKADGGKTVWTLPKGWAEEEGSGDRQALLRFGPDKPKLEMTVIRLDGDGGGTLANVNRWRDQMGLPKIAKDALETHTRKIEAALPVLLVDLRGPRRPASRGPHMGGGGAAPPSGQPTLDDIRGMFGYEVPSGWE